MQRHHKCLRKINYSKGAYSVARFVVTGGAGFIGSHLVELLVQNGHQVVVYDDLSTGMESNLSGIHGQIGFVRGDIRDHSALKSAMVGAEYVLHHAAEISAIRSVEEPEFVHDVNVTGTLNVLKCAKECGVKRLAFASSSAVYGDTGSAPQSESLLPQPLSPYGASKICAEHYCSVFHKLYGLETVRLRYFNVFGPRQNPKSQYAAVIPKFLHRVIAGQELHIYGDGGQTRDFVFVKDIARVNYAACFHESAAGRAFNIAAGRSISINELCELIMKVTGKRVDIIYDDAVPGEIRYSSSGGNAAREILGFEPLTSLESGLQEVYQHLLSL